LDPALDVRLLERHGDWARVQCSNGWTCWVDGNALIETGPAVGRPASAQAPAVAYQSLSPQQPAAGRARSVTAPIALVAGAVAIVSVFLPWFSFEGADANAMKVPLHFLVSTDSSPTNDAKLDSVGAFLILAAV